MKDVTAVVVETNKKINPPEHNFFFLLRTEMLFAGDGGECSEHNLHVQ